MERTGFFFFFFLSQMLMFARMEHCGYVVVAPFYVVYFWLRICTVCSLGALCAVLSLCLCLCLCLFCGFAVITGSHKAAVASAVTRVEVLIESFRRKQPFSHFLSFALNHPPIQEGFKRFKEEVLDHCSQVGRRLHFFFFWKVVLKLLMLPVIVLQNPCIIFLN